ncbi:hypothetical protein QTP86_025206 [Hemibagrus guttatus]|nr:hypothetical protein QTP86_025206 [Hemibagrus guttatus]
MEERRFEFKVGGTGSTSASHLQGWGFDSHLRRVCVEFACSPRASGVSSGFSGFLPRSKDMHCRLIGISKLSGVCVCVCVPCDELALRPGCILP